MSDTEASADEINRAMETEEDSALDTEEEPGDEEDTDQEDPGRYQEASPKLKKSPRPDPKKAKPAAKKSAPTSKAAPSGDGKKKKKTYDEMVLNTVKELKSRNGSSRAAILSYMKGAYDLEAVEDKIVGFHVSASIKRGITKGHLKHATDAGKGKNCFKLDVEGLELLKKAAAIDKAKAKPKSKSAEKKKTPSKSGTAKPKAKSKKEVVPTLKKTSSITAKNKLKASASRRSSIATPARSMKVSKVNKVAEPKSKSRAKKEAAKESAKSKKTSKAREASKKTSEEPDKKASKSKPDDTKAKPSAKGKVKAFSKDDVSPPSKAKPASKKKATKN